MNIVIALNVIDWHKSVIITNVLTFRFFHSKYNENSQAKAISHLIMDTQHR